MSVSSVLLPSEEMKFVHKKAFQQKHANPEWAYFVDVSTGDLKDFSTVSTSVLLIDSFT
jgi:hypothetical protein